MNKKVIVISIVTIVTLIIVILISYIITKNSNLGNKNKNVDQSNLSKDYTENKNVEMYKSEYIDINSKLAKEIFNFVPKYLQDYENKMSDEYIIYSAICNLEKEHEVPNNYTIGKDQFPGYKSDLIQAVARKIYGNSIELVKKEKYNLPIGYSSENDIFYKYPMGFGSTEEFQVIRELKENDTTYILTIYVLNVEYDINDLNHAYILTKDTFKLLRNKESNQNIIRKSMKKYELSGIELDVTPIVNEYKDELPLIEYELQKSDDIGTNYFIKNIKLILD